MNVVRRWPLTLAVLVGSALWACSLFAEAQWGSGGCSAAGPVGPPAHAVARQWVEPANDPGRVYLYENGRRAGGYCSISNRYLAWDAGRGDWASWAESQDPPADLPAKYRPPAKKAAAPKCCACSADCPCCECDCGASGVPCNPECPCGRAPPVVESVIQDGRPHPTGLMQERLHKNGEATLINGVESSKAGALDVIESGVPDFAAKFRVVILDDDHARRQQARAVLAALPECADAVVQALPKDHWCFRDSAGQLAFHVGGSPTIYYMAPDGRVLHRQDDYDGAAAAAGAFRKARADYDAAKDPDRRKNKPGPNQPGPAMPEWLNNPVVWIVGIVALVLFLNQRRTS